MTTPDRNKAERHRRLQERQTIIFGTISAVLLLLLAISLLQWFGVMPSPWTREFSSDDETAPSHTNACPAPGTVVLAPGEITTSVLNSTSMGGLASQVSGELAAMGITIGEVGNWDEPALDNPGIIEVGPDGHAAGFSLQRVLPGFVVIEVADQEGTGAIVVIGNQFQAVGDVTNLVAGDPVTVPADCES